MNSVGLQIYTVRDFTGTPEGLKDAFLQIKAAGYDYVQTAGLISDIESAKYFRECADNAGVGICGTHYNWKLIVENLEETIEVHKILGTTNVGIGGMPAEARTDKAALLAFIDQFNEIGAKLAKVGMKLTYHNHSFEFKRIEGKTLMEYLIEGFDKDNISFVLDTYWVQHGGYDVRKMIERLAGRVDILHLKDMGACHGGDKGNNPYITEIGNGNLNFEDIIPLAEKTGVQYFVVEQDTNFATGSAMESIKTSCDYIKANLMD